MPTLTLVFLSSVLGATITVDDDGPADHSTIGAAIVAASPGDLILVEPGNYPSFALDKDVTLLGRAGAARPQVSGNTLLISSAGFTVSGLSFKNLAILGVAGPAVVDDFSVGVFTAASETAALRVDAVDQLVLSRGVVIAAPLCGCHGALVQSSRVQIVDTSLFGGKGASAFAQGGPGGTALVVRTGSEAIVAGGARIQGGEEGFFDGFAGTDGPSGHAIRVVGSTVAVRGEVTDVVVHGDADPVFGQSFGNAILAEDSTVVWSGVTLDPNDIVLLNSTIVSPAAEPFLEITGQDPSPRVLRVIGPAGATGVLVGSLSPGDFDVPGYEAPFWLDLTALLIVVAVPTTGQAVELPVNIPPGFVGVTLRMQAVFPSVNGTLEPSELFVTNPAVLAVRF